MKRFSEQLKKRADALRMTSAEKRDLKSRVVAYMEYHPRTNAAPAETQTASRTTAVGGVLAFFRRYRIQGVLGTLAVIFMVSMPVLAERSLPGDVLYPLKRVNEQVRSSLTNSPYEKVEWETERLERRLAEARMLADEGKLTPEVESEVASAVKEHSDAAQESINSIRESDKDEAALAEITFSSALDVQSEMLEGRSATLSGAVNAARDVAVASQDGERPSYERLLARIERETTSAHEFFDTIATQASEEDQRDIEERLTGINERVELAKEKKETDYDAAIEMLSTALADTRKVISFMTNIDVRQNVSIEELLPTELTDKERVELIAARINDVSTKRATVTERLSVVDENTRVAAEERLAEINTLITNASSSLAAEELDAADEVSLAAHTLMTELIGVLDAFDSSDATSTPATSTSQTATSTHRASSTDHRSSSSDAAATE